MMWPFRKKVQFFSPQENDRIVEAIRLAEQETSGEIRLFVENKCKYVDPLDRAEELFQNLEMFKTKLRNSILLYVALKDRQLAIYADKGIHEAAGEDFWASAVKKIIGEFSSRTVSDGVISMIRESGRALAVHFPFDAAIDKNELPDDIIFGK